MKFVALNIYYEGHQHFDNLMKNTESHLAKWTHIHTRKIFMLSLGVPLNLPPDVHEYEL